MFNKFEYVYAVFVHKSFTKAAKELYISQPSLSAAIKKIEDKTPIIIPALNTKKK